MANAYVRALGNLYAAAAVVLSIAAVGDALTPMLIVRLVVCHGQEQALALFAIAIVLAAGLKSVLFPIAHHLGSMAEGPQVGRSVSRIYFGNIIGATLGPLGDGLHRARLPECR